MKFLRKPKVIEAMYFDGSAQSAIEIREWSRLDVEVHSKRSNGFYLSMMTKYGVGEALSSTWVVRGSCGLYYPCSDKEFKENYTSEFDPKDYK